MPFKQKLKYAILFALSFGILTTITFLAGVFINIQMAPPPVAQALSDFTGFAPTMMVGSIIIGFAQTFLSLYLYPAHQKWFWPVNLILAIFIGGLASFFSLWLIWILVALVNILLNYLMTRFLGTRRKLNTQ